MRVRDAVGWWATSPSWHKECSREWLTDKRRPNVAPPNTTRQSMPKNI
jgi:hypothetical protein